MFIRGLSAIFFAVALAGPAGAAVFNVNSASDLQAALASVSAGDEIVLTAGATIQYTNGAIDSAYFFSGANGTATQPITIRSASTTNLATIRGNDVASRILLRVTGDYWVIKDLKFTNGQKGIVLDNSNHSRISNVVVNGIGLEAIHVRDGSDYTVIENCSIFDVGISNPQFGEGIYIGSDRSVWRTPSSTSTSVYDPSVDYTTVRNCTLGPDIRAEAFDIKEGTSETVVEFNTIYGKGISRAAYEDSFIDLKGIRSYIRFNTFYQGNEPNILRGIAVLDRDRPLSGYEHVIHDNTFNMDNATTPLLEAYSGTSEVYAYNNTRNPVGEMYSSRVILSQPSWYGGSTPVNQLPNVSITGITSASPSGFVAGATINIAASASDPDGSIVDVAFYSGSVLLGRDGSFPYGINLLNPAAGSYSITAVATDNRGAARTSAAQTVVVTQPSGGGGGGNAQLAALYQRGDTNASDNRIRAHVQVQNNGSAPVSLADVKLRYWFTKEGTGTPAAAIDYSVIPSSHISTRFVNVSGSNYYVELSFAAGAGSLAAGASSGAIKLRITTSANVNLDESNDYSFGAAITSYQAYNKVALYQGSTLVWGIAP